MPRPLPPSTSSAASAATPSSAAAAGPGTDERPHGHALTVDVLLHPSHQLLRLPLPRLQPLRQQSRVGTHDCEGVGEAPGHRVRVHELDRTAAQAGLGHRGLHRRRRSAVHPDHNGGLCGRAPVRRRRGGRHHRHRAPGTRQDAQADRAEQQTGEPPTSAAADDQEVGVGGEGRQLRTGGAHERDGAPAGRQHGEDRVGHDLLQQSLRGTALAPQTRGPQLVLRHVQQVPPAAGRRSLPGDHVHHVQPVRGAGRPRGRPPGWPGAKVPVVPPTRVHACGPIVGSTAASRRRSCRPGTATIW